jgi:PKD repeat protein
MEKLYRILLFGWAIIYGGINIATAQYCYPRTTRNPSFNNYNFYIDRVIVGDIDNQDSYTPADTSYNDYTISGPMTNLTKGTTYSITVYTGPTAFYYNMFYAAWIDYNNDGDFSDAGENIFQHEVTTLSEIISKSFTVPTGASILKTRLRIRCTYTTASPFTVDPCASYTYGESEDYTVGLTDFLKTNPGITYAGEADVSFFNMGGDNDYDLIMNDEYSSTVPVRFYTNNGSGTFTLYDYTTGDLPDLDNDLLNYSLCDLNSDNALDVLFTYRKTDYTPKTVYFQKTGSFLAQTNTGIADLFRGSSETADLNNDGRNDVIICGEGTDGFPHLYIYQNATTGFVLVNDKLKALKGYIAVADYDRDSDVDLLVTGSDRYGNTNAVLYRNDNNWNFTEINANLYKFSYGNKPQFGDFNNDGLLDLICGKVYRNDGNNVFTEMMFPENYDARNTNRWMDIDNDGNLELIGSGDFGMVIYKYNGADSFLINQEVIGCEASDIGDVNADRKLDIYSNHYPNASIFKNQVSTTNNIPSAPSGLVSAIGDSGFFSVTLKWNKGSDDKTPSKGLTYNLRLGTTSLGNNIVSSMTSTSNSSLLKPGMGNVYNDTVWTIKNLNPGKYYWSVQTVDHSGNASVFATEQTFLILSPLKPSSFLVQGRINASGAGADFNADSDMDLIIKDSVLSIQNQTAINTYSYVKVRRNCEIIDIKDLNNDNLPDIIARHNKIQTVETHDSLSLFINIGNFTFSVINLDSISVYSVAAADFDNDGDIDIIAYDRGYYFYECTGNLHYSRTKLPMTELIIRSSLSAIDIDKDGDYDFIISGKDSNLSSTKCFTYIYKNNGDKNFTLSQSIIPGIGPSVFNATSFAQITNPADISWNDLNFDGYPDLLLTGDDEYRNNTCQIFLNDGTGFMTISSLSPRPADKYSPTWLDFNTDGYLDLIMPKIGWNVDYSVYFNDNNNSYTGFSNAVDSLTTSMFIKPIDVDQDKDKDIICTYKEPIGVDGFRAWTTVFTNTNNFVNQAPNYPTSLASRIDSFTVNLTWSKGFDKLTGYEGNTYNIWVGTASNTPDIVSPMSNLTTGYRYVEALGNAGTNTTWKLKNLPLGTYYWSVQTIDNSMTGSRWAPVKSFTLSALTANYTNDEVCLGFDTHLADNSVTTHPITSWRWVIGGITVSTAQNPVYRFITPGYNAVKLVVESSVAKDSITRNVYVKPVPESAFTNNTVCAGSATLFTNSTNTNGLTMSEWHWDFGDNSGSNVQNPGTHGYLLADTYNTKLVSVADNGCSDTIIKPVEVGMIPTAAITLSGLPNFCSGDSIKLTNSYTDTYIYSWQTGGLDITGATSNTYTAKQTGSYTVKVINPVGNCTSNSSPVNVTVKESPLQPAISYSGPTEFCAGDSLLLSVPKTNGLVYKWKLNGGSIGLSSNEYEARVSGNYHIIVTNENGTGCSSVSTNSVEVKVNDKPVATSLSIPLKTELCEGDFVILGVTASPAYGYQWLNDNVPVSGAINNTYRVVGTGKYQLEISNAKGCSIKTNSVNISVNTRPVKPLIDPANYLKGMCIGETPLKLSVKNAISGYTYEWYKNGAPLSDGTSVEDFFEDGYYFVEADLNGCKNASDSISLDFMESLPKPELTPKGPTVWYLSTSADANYYKWYFNGNQILGATTNTYVAGQKLGTYRVSVSDDNSCFRMSDPKTIPPDIVGIEDTDPFEGVRIYPNPTTGWFTIEMDNNIFGDLLIDIFTQNGSKTLNIKFEKTTEHFSSQIDLSGQAKGLYVINMAIKKYSATRKILIE